MILWFLYAVSLLVVWFENQCIVLPLWDRPLIFRSRALYWLIRLVLTYGTLIGLWMKYGVEAAAIAFAFYYVFNKLTFKKYFDRQVKETAARLIKTWHESPYFSLGRDKPPDQATVVREVLEAARESVIRNVKGGSL